MPGVSNWRQSIDLHTGIVTTTATWTAPDGHVTDLSYEVLTDRANPYLGLVRLQFTPHWSGVATVTDAIDGTADTTATPELTTSGDQGLERRGASGLGDDRRPRARGSRRRSPASSRSAPTSSRPPRRPTRPPTRASARSSGSRCSRARRTRSPSTSASRARRTRRTADRRPGAGGGRGRHRLGLAARRPTTCAWASLWRGWIEVLGNRTLATDVNASQFYLWSSTRDGVDWSVSPAGLSSNGYDGHIFWDAETWMYPSLLAQHPDLAAGMNAYRFQRLTEAEQHAAATGYEGRALPVGERARWHRADPAADLGQQRGPVRAAHHR